MPTHTTFAKLRASRDLQNFSIVEYLNVSDSRLVCLVNLQMDYQLGVSQDLA